MPRVACQAHTLGQLLPLVVLLQAPLRAEHLGALPEPTGRDRWGAERAAAPHNIGADSNQSQARALQGPGRWQWPKHTFLSLDGLRPAYTEAVAQAGRTYSSLVIGVPPPPCTSQSSAQSLLEPLLAAHVHGGQPLEVRVRVSDALPPSRLFLGPSLSDGYNIALANGSASISRGVAAANHAGQLLQGGNLTESFWVSSSLDRGRVSVRLGQGGTLGQAEVLVLEDYAPPAGFNEGMSLWLLPSPGQWEICLISAGTTLEAAEHPAPTLKLVRSGSDCRSPAVPMLAAESVWLLALVDASLSSSGTPFAFMHGGHYSLCYAPDAGTTSSPLPIQLRVLGVASWCSEDGCLARERWDCFFDKLGASSGPCSIDVSPETGRAGWSLTPGQVSRMTWTDSYGPDEQIGGVLQRSSPKHCGENASASTSFEASATSLELRTAASMPRVRPGTFEPFTVGVCYCPDMALYEGRCSSREDFIQPFGVLYMWTISICDHDANGACPAAYMRVIPQQPFMLKVHCPPGAGCTAGLGSRVKFLDARTSWGHSNWEASAPCRAVREESADAVWPGQGDSLAVSGGSRVDYKVWAEKQVLLNRTLGHNFDVCYCNDDCHLPENWIQVGNVRTSTAFAFASATTSALDGSALRTVESVNKPGSFTLLSGLHTPTWQTIASPYDGHQFSGFALLNLRAFEAPTEQSQGTMDSECQRGDLSPDLVEGLGSQAEMLSRMAFAHAEAGTEGVRFAFAGAARDQELVVRKAGTLAVCYCGRALSSGSCLAPEHWLFAGLLQIKGPRGGQSWALPTRTLVRIAGVQGWGFDSTDALRILDAGASCSDSDFVPSGSTSIKAACSAAACVEATAETLVAGVIADSESTGLHIESILLEGAQSSVLSFSGPVSGLINEGDYITINPDDILVDGRALGQMNDVQRFAAYRLSGYGAFQDDLTRRFLRHPHRVTHVGQRKHNATEPGSGRVASKLRVSVGWDSAQLGGIPSFSFRSPTPGSPQWVRRNVMDTKRELKAATTRPRMPICWSPLDSGSHKSFAQAGEVTFEDPGFMPAAAFALTARQAGATAPAVIAFTVDALKTAYRGARGEMLLTLRFLQAGKVSMAGLDAIGALTPADMSQAACGRLFLELWASDDHGFPVPRGCYHGAVGATGEPLERELLVVFDRFNGLRNSCGGGPCHYQLVLDVTATELSAGEQVLELYTGCRYEAGGCRSEFEVYERGDAAAVVGTLEGAGPDDARLGSFELLGGNDGSGVHHISAPQANIQARVVAEGPPGLQRGSILRIFLSPLTQWDVGSGACQAHSAPSAGNSSAGGVSFCDKEQVLQVLPQRHNVLKVTLQQEMDAFGLVPHDVNVTGLALPVAALFPRTLGVQVSSPADGAPSYVSSSPLAFLGEGSPAAEARLLLTGRTGGGPRPFVGDTNLLHVRLHFPATLQAASAGTAFVDVLPPPGYSCHVRGSGAAPHTFEDAYEGYALLRQQDAPYDNEATTLFLLDRDLDDLPDFPRGSLSTSASDGSWEPSLGQPGCSYDFGPGQAIHAGQVVYVELTVSNPTAPLRRSDPTNVWALRLRWLDSRGAHYTTRTEPFHEVAAEQDIWAGNAAVLAPLCDVFVQPSSFAVGATHMLSVFFGVVQGLGSGGEVVVDAPLSYSFGESCTVGVIEPSLHPLALDPVLRLAHSGDCRGVPSPESGGLGSNRAWVSVRSGLLAGRTYAFRLQVTNPLHLPGNGSWHVWTAEAVGFMVDGSAKAAAFTREEEGWQLYRQSWRWPPQISVEGGLLRPFHVFHELTTLVVHNLSLPSAASTSLRVSAPPECLFGDPALVEASASGSTLPLPHAPVLRGPTQLLWPSLFLRGGELYGFRAPLHVLEAAPHASAHAFFLELGYAGGRLGAVTVAAPPLARIVVAPVGYLTSQLGHRFNVLVFRLWTASPVLAPGQLTFHGGEGLRGSHLACPPKAVLGESLPLPWDTRCEVGHDAVGAPFMHLRPAAAAFEAGQYALEVQASNPPLSSTQSLLAWTVGTSVAGAPIDAPASAAGFPLRRRAVSTAIVPEALRDDRPSHNSSVLLTFTLTFQGEQPESSQLNVRAPLGFTFAEECTAVPDSDAGTGFEVDWPPVRACVGDGHTAAITVGRGFKSGSKYALRLAVVNPRHQPSMNWWTVEYDLTTSDLVQGFPVALITFPLPVSAVNVAALQSLEAPVTFVFLLEQPVSPGGELQLTAPPGFTLRSATALRTRTTVPGAQALAEEPLSAQAAGGAALTVQVGSLGLPANVPQVLQVLVVNLASGGGGQPWTLASFSATGGQGHPLDEGTVAGYSLVDAATIIVGNVGGHYYSLEAVNVSINIASPLPLLFEDRLVLEAPSGFVLTASAHSEECAGFVWVTEPLAALRPLCSCSFGACVLSFVLGPSDQASWPLEFQLLSANPVQEPPLERSYWRVRHLRDGTLVASAAQRSWQVRSLLWPASVSLVGARQAARAESALLISFMPAIGAEAASLLAERPMEMSFDEAAVEAPARKSDRSAGAELVFLMRLAVGAEVSVLVSRVRLGRGGGRSIFSLVTYSGSWAPLQERLHFEGFFQPGQASLQGTLKSAYAAKPEAFPARSALPARGHEDAQAVFVVSFSFAVAVGDRMLLQCEGGGAYSLREGLEASVLPGREPIQLIVHAHGEHGIEATFLGGGDAEVTVTAQERALRQLSSGGEVLRLGREAELKLWLVPTLGINTWRLEVFRDGLLTNTNDGISAGFAPVAPLSVQLHAARAPPAAIVELQLLASAVGLSSVPELVVVAPPGFGFPADCGQTCEALSDTFASRATAALRPASGSALGQQLGFSVTTPARVLERRPWLVQAMGEVSAWGDAEPFELLPMPTSVLYGAVQGLSKAQLVFEFDVAAETGERTIEVSAPETFVLSCREGEFQPVSLQSPECERDGPGQLSMHLVLAPGPHAFSAQAELSQETPAVNEFSLVLRDRTTGVVVDAAFDLPGQPLVALPVSQPRLAWTTADLGGRSRVTVSFALSNRTEQVRALLVCLPPGLRQAVRSPADVKSSNAKLPLLKGGQDWVDATSPTRLRVLLETSDPTMAEGSYRLTFPVDLPEAAASISPRNLWHLDFCSEKFCLEPRSSSSIASFPMAGFMPGEVSELEKARAEAASAGTVQDTNGAWRKASAGGLPLLLSLWAAWV